MKRQTTIDKAFEINKNPRIYGSFAEIGAGQETVNFFYKAGMASQTVAKSMSAYDMTVSNEIYGKQSRYVCKNRLYNMLDHEYRLLKRRLEKQLGEKKTFFVFATTAVTSTRKKDTPFLNKQHAWMGLRFQAKPGQAFSDIVFHLNCLDKNRLQQHEALGILGVNLIYACFHCMNSSKKFISSLKENLPSSRVEIHGLSCTGPAFKKLSSATINLETLSQSLSPFAFFSAPEKSDFLTDVSFEKNPLILYGDKNLLKEFKKRKASILKSLSLKIKQTLLIFFLPEKKSITKLFSKRELSQLYKSGFSTLIAPKVSLEELKNQISSHTIKPLTFIVSENYFTKKLFNPLLFKKRFLLKSLGLLFDKKTRLAVFSKNKNFSVKTKELAYKQEHLLKDYLVSKKQVIDIH